MTNCPNCGAPIVASRCEYCGTVFRAPEPIESRIRQTSDEITFDLYSAYKNAGDNASVNVIMGCLKSGILTPNEAKTMMTNSILTKHVTDILKRR